MPAMVALCASIDPFASAEQYCTNTNDNSNNTSECGCHSQSQSHAGYCSVVEQRPAAWSFLVYAARSVAEGHIAGVHPQSQMQRLLNKRQHNGVSLHMGVDKREGSVHGREVEMRVSEDVVEPEF